MASDGQASTHEPQSMHKSGSIEYLSPSKIASDGHSSMQLPHAMQSSLITYAIISFFLVCGAKVILFIHPSKNTLSIF